MTTAITAGLGALSTMKRMGMGAPVPTKVEDRGSYWIVTYDNGTFDNVPKDLTALVLAAQTAHAAGQGDLEAKYAMWIANMKAGNPPVDLGFRSQHPYLFWGGITAGSAALLGTVFYLAKHR